MCCGKSVLETRRGCRSWKCWEVEQTTSERSLGGWVGVSQVKGRRSLGVDQEDVTREVGGKLQNKRWLSFIEHWLRARLWVRSRCHYPQSANEESESPDSPEVVAGFVRGRTAFKNPVSSQDGGRSWVAVSCCWKVRCAGEVLKCPGAFIVTRLRIWEMVTVSLFKCQELCLALGII